MLELRPLSGSPGRGTAMVPGCLTGESEERETWTAESLRAALSRRSNSSTEAADETSAVDVSGQHCGCEGEQSSEQSKWDLVKRCDQPRSNVSNLRGLSLLRANA